MTLESATALYWSAVRPAIRKGCFTNGLRLLEIQDQFPDRTLGRVAATTARMAWDARQERLRTCGIRVVEVAS